MPRGTTPVEDVKQKKMMPRETILVEDKKQNVGIYYTEKVYILYIER